MAKRKKYPKLPNGYGSIRYIGSNRTAPYAVHPPTTEFKENGSPIRPKAIAYVDDWMKGFGILTLYNNGVYTPGQEPPELLSCSSTDELVQSIISDYNKAKLAHSKIVPSKTFAEVYREFFDYKYNQDKSKTYSDSSKNSTNAAFNNVKQLHNKMFMDLRHDDLQKAVDDCPLKHSSQELIVSLFHQMYAYADVKEIVIKDYSAHVRINIPDDDEQGVPFSEEELSILWKNKDNPTIELILIMCYSGYRIAAYQSMEVNLIDKYFKGGVKTRSSKERMVPIHSAILPLVENRVNRLGRLLPYSPTTYRREMYSALKKLEIGKHTPHDCRHTFSMLCEKYGVNENDRKRLLGHSFTTSDITNKIYGHRSLDDLRIEVEKIKVCV